MRTSKKSPGEPGAPRCSNGQQVQTTAAKASAEITQPNMNPWFMKASNFDVPAEEYGQGWYTSYRVARDLMAFVERQQTPADAEHAAFLLRCVLGECFPIVSMREEGASRYGAACAVVSVLMQLLAATPRAFKVDEFIDSHAARQRLRDDVSRQKKETPDAVAPLAPTVGAVASSDLTSCRAAADAEAKAGAIMAMASRSKVPA